MVLISANSAIWAKFRGVNYARKTCSVSFTVLSPGASIWIQPTTNFPHKKIKRIGQIDQKLLVKAA